MPKALLSLPKAVQRLRKHYGPPPSPFTRDPFEMILMENVAYLTTPERRREAFDQLKKTVGTSPIALLTAKNEDLERVTGRGILKGAFADKLRECGRIAVEKFDGDLGPAMREPLDKAKRALRSFPGIGEPGAEKILLFSGRQPLLAPDSNGLRVLARLGLVREDKSYSKTYAAGREAGSALPAKPSVLREAHLLLQQHGRTLCKGATPRCEECPLADGCAHVRRR